MVNYLDSRRIMGTTAERSSIPTPATIGGWVELGRTTLGSSSSTIDVTSLADKRYYMVLHNVVGKNTVTVDDGIRLGNGSFDTGSNYARRRNVNGGTDSTATSQTSALLASSDANPQFDISYMANYSSKEKLGITHRVHQGGTGSGSIGNRQEFVWKWANTSNPIDRWQFWSGGSDTFNTGSEVVVLGWDESDTHTTNFWEELADVTLSSAGDTIDATITSKKYIWIQAYLKNSGSLDNCRIYLGNTTIDTGSNYAFRHSTNGAADGTNGSMQGAWFTVTNAAQSVFVNMFIVNNASNEKLIISHANYDGGAGAGNAPQRTEMVGKWANTSNQFDKIQLYNAGTGDFDTGSFIKVWGSD
jgi:hypothetical protein